MGKEYIDILIEKTKVSAKDVDSNYWNELMDEIKKWLKSKPSKKDRDKFYRKAWVERVFMCSDYSDDK